MIDFDRPPVTFTARCLDGPLCGRVRTSPNPTFTVWRDERTPAGEYRYSARHGSWLWKAAT